MFHVRRRPVDSQPRRRKKKTGAGANAGNGRPGTEPALLEVAPDGSPLENGRRVRIIDVIEVTKHSPDKRNISTRRLLIYAELNLVDDGGTD